MANKRRREVANGTPETTKMVADLPASDTSPESVPESEAIDPANQGSQGGYEQFREQRIKENRERMQKLGIVNLSLKLKTAVAAKRAPRNFSSDRKTPIRASSLLATEPRRRSSRLQNVDPVSYAEDAKLPKQEGKRMKDWILMEEGAKPEVYTEEHEKLLGSTELEWTLFVDGYGADGKRIYDSINGKTCHQCRQKTLGHRTHCCKCQIVQGQFCGDCLYMRYGEHVLEAKKNPDWICPPCRGICNCSLCRQAKGWPPTGAMYKKITNLGYKSVAHFLIENKRAPPATEAVEEEDVGKTPHSAKRSLAFTDTEVLVDGNEPSKKMISGQKLEYEEKENGESKDGKGEQEDCHTNDISMLDVGQEKTGESDKQDEYKKGDVFNLNVGDKETGENKDEKKDEQEYEKGRDSDDISNGNLNVGDKETGENKDKKKDEQEYEIGKGSDVSNGNLNVGDKVTGENKDEKVEQEYEKGKENLCPETELVNDHRMEDVSSPDQSKKTVSSCEPKTVSVARMTRRKNKLSETENCKDSIARRLRSRTNGA